MVCSALLGWSTLMTWILEAITPSNGTTKAAEVVREIPVGGRNNALASIAGTLLSLGHSGSFVACVGELVLPPVALVETADQSAKPSKRTRTVDSVPLALDDCEADTSTA